jgi:hypothetical protein
MNEQDVRTLLDDLASTPAPPSQVDVQRAVTTVRRQARTRAWVSAAAAILVVGLGAGITYATMDNSAPATGSTPTNAPTTAPVTSAPTRFDPLVQYASFDWLPSDKLTWRSTSINPERFAMSAGEYVPDPANGPNAALPAPSVDVRLYAAGVVPQTEKPIEAQIPGGGTQTVNYGPVTDAPAVDGAPAYWVGAPGGSEMIILKWRYAPDGWAELYVSQFDGDQREIAHRVASALSVGSTERLRFPFHLSGLPAGLRPTSSAFDEGGLTWPWHASLDLNTQADGTGPGVSVAVNPTTDQSDGRAPNTTVDGHPARRETFGGDHLGRPEYSDRLYVYDVEGLEATVFISATTVEAAAPLGADGALGLYRTVTVHPDRADWTDQPVR